MTRVMIFRLNHVSSIPRRIRNSQHVLSKAWREIRALPTSVSSRSQRRSFVTPPPGSLNYLWKCPPPPRKPCRMCVFRWRIVEEFAFYHRLTKLPIGIPSTSTEALSNVFLLRWWRVCLLCFLPTGSQNYQLECIQPLRKSCRMKVLDELLKSIAHLDFHQRGHKTTNWNAYNLYEALIECVSLDA